jgi:hypothetical protein
VHRWTSTYLPKFMEKKINHKTQNANRRRARACRPTPSPHIHKYVYINSNTHTYIYTSVKAPTSQNTKRQAPPPPIYKYIYVCNSLSQHIYIHPSNKTPTNQNTTPTGAPVPPKPTGWVVDRMDIKNFQCKVSDKILSLTHTDIYNVYILYTSPLTHPPTN